MHQENYPYLETKAKLLEQALLKNPHASKLLYEIALLKFQLKEYNEAKSWFYKALEKDKNENIYCFLSDIYLLDRQYEKSIEILKQGIKELPNSPLLNYRTGIVQLNLKKTTEDLIPYFEKVISLEPDNFNARIAISRVLLMKKQYQRALDICSSLLEERIYYTPIIAQIITIYQKWGKLDNVNKLLNYQSLLKTFNINIEESDWTSLSTFHKSLLKELEKEVWYYEPNNKATLRGKQTETLNLNIGKTYKAFEHFIHQIINKYISQLSEDKNHAFIKNIPKKYNIEMWAVKLYEGGKQRAHNHSKGWLSGVYYIKVPKALKQQDGALGFKISEDDPTSETTITIKPQEGQFVLFPSYYYHYTIPFSSDEERICIAFDIVPEQS